MVASPALHFNNLPHSGKNFKIQIITFREICNNMLHFYISVALDFNIEQDFYFLCSSQILIYVFCAYGPKTEASAVTTWLIYDPARRYLDLDLELDLDFDFDLDLDLDLDLVQA